MYGRVSDAGMGPYPPLLLLRTADLCCCCAAAAAAAVLCGCNPAALRLTVGNAVLRDRDPAALQLADCNPRDYRQWSARDGHGWAWHETQCSAGCVAQPLYPWRRAGLKRSGSLGRVDKTDRDRQTKSNKTHRLLEV